MFLVDGKPSLFPAGAQPHLTMVLVSPGTVVTDPALPDKEVVVSDGNSVIVADHLYCTPVTFQHMRMYDPKSLH